MLLTHFALQMEAKESARTLTKGEPFIDMSTKTGLNIDGAVLILVLIGEGTGPRVICPRSPPISVM
jgi:hypothetical protein